MKNIFFVLILVSNSLFATNYYLSSSGNDANRGTSPSTAWQNVIKIQSTAYGAGFFPGDSILLKRGDTFVGMFFLPNSGTSGNPIYIGAYGTGANPIITRKDFVPGWDQAGKWASSGANTWYISQSFNPGRLWLSGVEYGPSKTSVINSIQRWNWDQTTNRLYVYSTSNPASFYSSIKQSAPGGDFFSSITFYLYQASYITVENVDLRGAAGNRVTQCTNVTIRNCSMGFESTSALLVYNSDDCLFENNTFDSGDRIIDQWYRQTGCLDGLSIYEGGSRNIIRYNTFKDWGHTSIYLFANTDGSIMKDNKVYGNYFNSADIDYNRAFAADKIGSGGNTSGNEFYYNYCEHHTAPIQINFPGLKFHHNIINEVTNAIHGGPSGAGAPIAFGIGIQGYSNTQPHNMSIYNNVFANCDEAGFYYNKNPGDNTPHDNYFINNIIYNCGRSGSNYQLIINNDNGVGSLIARNNILFKQGVTALVANGHFASSYPALANDRTVAQFNNDNGLSGDSISNNINVDPMFTNTSTGDFTLQKNSPALASATNTGVFLDKGLSPNSTWPLGITELSYNLQWNIGPYVNAGNLAPVANAGNDQFITLPVNSVNLAGSATDANGTITSYLWTQIAGPSTAIITNPNAQVTSVTGLIKGIYQFQLTVSNIAGAAARDTMIVTVNEAKGSPVANAGNDQAITLPVNSIKLTGSATNVAGTATSYVWTQIAGPSPGIITDANALVTSVTGLIRGIYQFKLTVSDLYYGTGDDTMQVVVTGSTLPVTNLNLSGKVAVNANILEWTSETEQNNLGFEVQHATIMANFSKIGFQATKGVDGISSTIISYYFSDESRQKGINYYRLKQIDKDGKSIYSNIVELKNIDAITLWSITLYPNPAASVLNVKSAYFGNNKIWFRITDVNGKTVVNNVANIGYGDNTTKINIGNLSPGTYFLIGILIDGNQKIVKKFEKL